MSNQQHKLIRPLIGYFLGWGDDLIPHRYIKLATTEGEQLVKVAKILRAQIQDWRPGICLTLLSEERICRSTGKRKIKVKQLLTPPVNLLSQRSETSRQPIECSPVTSNLTTPIKVRICQGSSCRRQGSDKICQLMQTHLDGHNLADRVQIETVKCLHQCKAAPHAIFTSPVGSTLPGKTHYRQIQPSQVQAILAKHLPIVAPSESIGTSLIEKISTFSTYLQQHQISIATPH